MPHFPDERWLTWFDRLSNDDYCVIDHFLSTEMLKEVNRFFLERIHDDALNQAGVGTQSAFKVIRSVRGDHIYWLSEKNDEGLASVFSLINETKTMLNRYCYLSLSGWEFHLAHYPKGTHYERHLDQFRERNNRLISMVIYLNENWQPGDGGELRLFTTDGEMNIEPIACRAILFRSEKLEHEVLETMKDRYSITGWFLYQPVGLGYLG